MIITATLILHVHLPGCRSLEEKRRRLKPLLARLHREFNVSAAELDHHEAWQSATIGCTMLGNDAAHLQRQMHTVSAWIDRHRPDVYIVEERIELR